MKVHHSSGLILRSPNTQPGWSKTCTRSIRKQSTFTDVEAGSPRGSVAGVRWGSASAGLELMHCPLDEAAEVLLFTFRHNTLRIHWCGHFCLFIKTAGDAESDTHKVKGHLWPFSSLRCSGTHQNVNQAWHLVLQTRHCRRQQVWRIRFWAFKVWKNPHASEGHLFSH